MFLNFIILHIYIHELMDYTYYIYEWRLNIQYLYKFLNLERRKHVQEIDTCQPISNTLQVDQTEMDPWDCDKKPKGCCFSASRESFLSQFCYLFASCGFLLFLLFSFPSLINTTTTTLAFLQPCLIQLEKSFFLQNSSINISYSLLTHFVAQNCTENSYN